MSTSKDISEFTTSRSNQVSFRAKTIDWEVKCRTIFVHNLYPNLSDNDHHRIFSRFGDVHDLYRSHSTDERYVSVRITFFDLRSASAAVSAYHRFRMGGRYTTAHFYAKFEIRAQLSPFSRHCTWEVSTKNYGTIIVSRTDGLTMEKVRELFGSYGAVKDVQKRCPETKNLNVEFFDVRDAEKAMKALNMKKIGVQQIRLRFGYIYLQYSPLCRSSRIEAGSKPVSTSVPSHQHKVEPRIHPSRTLPGFLKAHQSVQIAPTRSVLHSISTPTPLMRCNRKKHSECGSIHCPGDDETVHSTGSDSATVFENTNSSGRKYLSLFGGPTFMDIIRRSISMKLPNGHASAYQKICAFWGNHRQHEQKISLPTTSSSHLKPIASFSPRSHTTIPSTCDVDQFEHISDKENEKDRNVATVELGSRERSKERENAPNATYVDVARMTNTENLTYNVCHDVKQSEMGLGYRKSLQPRKYIDVVKADLEKESNNMGHFSRFYMR